MNQPNKQPSHLLRNSHDGTARLHTVSIPSMFEQAILQNTGKPWSLIASLTLQSAVAGAAILASIWTVEQMRPVPLPQPLPIYRKVLPVKLMPMTNGGVSNGRPNSSPPVRPMVIPRGRPSALPTSLDPIPEIPQGSGLDIPGAKLSAGMIVELPSAFAEQPPARISPPPEQEKPAPPHAPTRVSSGLLEGKLINRVMPKYPPMALQTRTAGAVQLSAVIGKDGSVKSLHVVSGHQLLIRSALDAVAQWRYRPFLLNGEPVEVIGLVEVNFRLN